MHGEPHIRLVQFIQLLTEMSGRLYSVNWYREQLCAAEGSERKIKQDEPWFNLHRNVS